MRRRRKAGGLLRVWTDGVAAATTLSVRVPQLLTGTMSPGEAQRMVAEKISAAQEGWVKAAGAAMRIGVRERRPTLTASQAFRVLEAAVGPASRTVRANAKRLGVKPKRKA